MLHRLLPRAVSLVAIPALLAAQEAAPLTERERLLLERVERLERRLSALEVTAPAVSVPPPPPAAALANTAPAPEPPSPGVLSGTTVNVNLDTFYGYNLNRPVGRVNLLRAYDATANTLAINQAGLVIERAPDLDAGRRVGLRVDLMFGQATEAAQGGAQNEPRPQVYRNLFQAYGSYQANKQWRVDFGKFASALGPEGTYTKDQFTYSRSYWFSFLPFYHMGLRTSYDVSSQLNVQYWLVNGANQTEDFNGFKSQNFNFTYKPTAHVAWTGNYYLGQEQRGLVPALNPGIPSLPTQPGLSVTPVPGGTPRGRFHVLDTYVSIDATNKLTLLGELDTVINRVNPGDAPQRVTGGAAYARYQFVPAFSLAGRFAVLKDKGGLFSGTTQTLKDTTLAATWQPVDGFQTRLEWRRDFSNTPFFLTATPGLLKKEQNTATLGLVWWFGGKSGAW